MVDQNKKKLSNKPEIVYVLRGDPSYMGTIRFNGGPFIEGQRANRLRDSISLTSQYDKEEPTEYYRPLVLVIDFYFPMPIRPTEKSPARKCKEFYSIGPHISHCIKYLESLMETILFEDSAIIASVKAEKKYDKDPRTEFYLLEL